MVFSPNYNSQPMIGLYAKEIPLEFVLYNPLFSDMTVLLG
jgi:hypothetical protein